LENMDICDINQVVKQISTLYKANMEDYFDLLTIWFRDILYMKSTKDVNHIIFRDEIYDIKKQAEKYSYFEIETILNALKKAKAQLKANVNFDLVVELLLFTIKENEKL
ncbi:MAG: DNA polymerase III subunit delta, partial [Lachnospiraceae bacterium]|nr:DNA polymerase III subunit delta [Lachnospiraceae bacterium]